MSGGAYHGAWETSVRSRVPGPGVVDDDSGLPDMTVLAALLGRRARSVISEVLRLKREKGFVLRDA